MKIKTWRLGNFISGMQNAFVAFLRIWTIPIVIMLSVASGYTTYFGMSHFITWWIALIITVAVQSILVICSLEIAGMRWQANRMRYLTVMTSLLVAMATSVSFSYFKFYEISQQERLRIERFAGLQAAIDGYMNDLFRAKSEILATQQAATDKAQREANMAYLGTHPDMSPGFRNLVGKGPFWSRYNDLYEAERGRMHKLDEGFQGLNAYIRELHDALNAFNVTHYEDHLAYQAIITQFQRVETRFNELITSYGRAARQSPVLMTYEQFAQGVTPSFSMWQDFSLFAFACALIVDFFTFLLSYRLEFSANGPLNEQESELAYECLSQFSQLKINRNDELEIVIEKTELERARRVSDWTRMFGAAFLLNRGYLRKVDDRSVEFAPNLYPVIAEHLRKKLSSGDAERAAMQHYEELIRKLLEKAKHE